MPTSTPGSAPRPSALSRLRLVQRRSRVGCRHCDHLLLLCPLGPACPGASLLRPVTCRECSWGLRCPDHGRHWTTA